MRAPFVLIYSSFAKSIMFPFPILPLFRQSCPQLKPHFFLAHDWGHVMDLRWLPVPVQCANRSDGCEITRPLPPVDMTPIQIAQLIGAVVGHLIAACTDGFVRIFLVPAADNRFNLPEEFKVVLPTKICNGVPKNVYQFKPKTVLRLAPSTGNSEIPFGLHL